jgi:hypothetical protein
MEWIKCSDKLPLDGQRVIVYALGAFDIGGRHINNVNIGYCHFFCHNRNTFEDCDSDDIKNVTHWMPLPQPPIQIEK